MSMNSQAIQQGSCLFLSSPDLWGRLIFSTGYAWLPPFSFCLYNTTFVLLSFRSVFLVHGSWKTLCFIVHAIYRAPSISSTPSNETHSRGCSWYYYRFLASIPLISQTIRRNLETISVVAWCDGEYKECGPELITRVTSYAHVRVYVCLCVGGGGGGRSSVCACWHSISSGLYRM